MILENAEGRILLLLSTKIILLTFGFLQYFCIASVVVFAIHIVGMMMSIINCS